MRAINSYMSNYFLYTYREQVAIFFAVNYAFFCVFLFHNFSMAQIRIEFGERIGMRLHRNLLRTSLLRKSDQYIFNSSISDAMVHCGADNLSISSLIPYFMHVCTVAPNFLYRVHDRSEGNNYTRDENAPLFRAIFATQRNTAQLDISMMYSCQRNEW
jgi:hypothetical protein